jgi:hypothetical protein
MLKRLKRWLGWESESDYLDLASAPSHAPTPPPAPKPVVTVQTRAPQAPATPKPPKERTPLEVLDDPRLTLDKPADDGFDPYNTGAFNRSASWERIGRQRKR